MRCKCREKGAEARHAFFDVEIVSDKTVTHQWCVPCLFNCRCRHCWILLISISISISISFDCWAGSSELLTFLWYFFLLMAGSCSGANMLALLGSTPMSIPRQLSNDNGTPKNIENARV